MANNIIKGRKGGGSKQRTPTEQPDDLQSVAKAKILLALGEGEFAGGLTGKDIYLDGTPLENADGSQNFSGVSWEFRPGTQAQTYIQGIPGTENEISVGTEVSSKTAWTHTFTNTQLSAVRVRLKWPSLMKQEDDGDVVGNTVKYAIDLQTDGGAWQTVLETAVTGKTTSGYERSHRIDLPQAGSTWTLRLRKISPDANSVKVGDVMTLQSYTEVIDAKLRYPNTALLYIEFDSSQFNGSIPQISCEPRGRVIRVPDNYNPETREYTGVWTGGFKWAWTDNPAWIYYDIVIADRFGLGNRLSSANISKWTLYQIAQYCDQLVPDGRGGDGMEPRYTCNVYVQERNDAYTVLRDFAAIFRGMTCWNGEQIVVQADMPRDVDFTYTRANIVGKPRYSSSSSQVRYTNALVSWSDPDNAYADAMEPAFIPELVSRYSFNQLELTAIGCTRQSEAHRKGLWGILTNNKDRVVEFDVGLDGRIPQPGYIIALADELLAGRVNGGRISAVNGRVITLDRDVDAKPGDRLQLNLPSGISQSRTIQAVNGRRQITVTTAYSETPERECVWAVESNDLFLQQYRVTGVKENGDATLTITGVSHDPDKFARIDTGAIIDQRPVSVLPAGNQSPPDDIVITSRSVVNQGISVETMQVNWSAVSGAIAYEAQWRRNDGNWINVPRSSTTSFEVSGIYAGRYLVRVRAINAAEISSGWAYSEEKTLTGKVGEPLAPLALATRSLVHGVQVSWEFPTGSGDTLRTELQYSKNQDGSAPMPLSDVAYPGKSYQQMGLSMGAEFWYRARLVDRLGNESPWTGWVQGMASDNFDDYYENLTDAIKDTDAWEETQRTISETQEGIRNTQQELEQTAEELRQEAADQAKQVSQDIDASAKSITADVDGKISAVNKTITDELTSVNESLDSGLAQANKGIQEAKSAVADANQQIAILSKSLADGDAALNALTQTDANVASKADQTAMNSLTGRVEKTESGLTAANSNITSLSSSLSQQSKRGANLLPDGTFESYAVGHNLSNNRVIVTTDDSHGGNKCIRVTRPNDYNANATDNSDNHIFSGFQVRDNAVFYMECWVKRDAKSTAMAENAQISIGLSLQYQDNSWQWPAVTKAAKDLSSTQWTKVFGYLKSTKSGIKQAMVRISIPNVSSVKAGNSFLIDDLVITEVTDAYNAQSTADANANAISTLNSTVSQQGDQITSQGNSITKLTNDLATTNNNVSNKADANALTALTNRVTQTEKDINSTSSSVTNLNNKVDSISVGGTNLIKNSGDMTGWSNVTSETYRGNAVIGATVKAGSGYKDLREITLESPVDAGEYVYSFYAKGGVAGQTMTALFYNPNTTTSIETSQGAKGNNTDGRAQFTLTTSWARYWVKWKQTPTTGTKRLILCRIESNTSKDQTVYINSPKFEVGNVVSDWNDSPADSASASAVDLLTTTVNQQGTSISSIGNRTTSLENGLSTAQNNIARKADASALQDLRNTVTSLGGDLTAANSSITSLQASMNRRTVFTVTARGNGNSVTTGVFDESGKNLFTPGRSWALVTFAKHSDGSTVIATSKTYDVFGSANNGATMSADIEALASGTYVCVLTFDEPSGNRGKILSALESLGGTSEVVNSLPYRGAYILLGRKGMRSGDGLELRAPTGGDATAHISTSVEFVNGIMMGLGAAGGVMMKADANASAITTLQNTVKTQGGNIDSLSSSITALENSLRSTNDTVSKKADTTAVSSLTGRVSQVENTITSQSQSITSLTSSINTISTQGANPWVDGTFESYGDGHVLGGGGTAVVVASQKFTGNKSLQVSRGANNNGNSDKQLGSWQSVREDAKFRFEFWAMMPADQAPSSGWTTLVGINSLNAAGQNSWQSAVTVSEAALGARDKWVKFTGIASNNGGGRTRAVVWISTRGASGSGTPGYSLYIDDLVITDVTDAKAAQDASDATASAVSGLTARVTDAEGKITAQAQQQTALATKVDNANSRVDNMAKTLSDSQSTQASLNTSLQSQIDAQAAANIKNQTTLDNTIKSVASITSTQQTHATALEALATQQTTLTSSVGDLSASVQNTAKTVADVNGTVSSLWSMKVETVNGKNVGAGITLGSNGETSDMILYADRFSLFNRNNATAVPVMVAEGNELYIDTARIKNSSLTSTKIADGSITNAKIGNEIRSNDFVDGSRGWRIAKDGSSQFNNVIVRGAVYATDGWFQGTVYANHIEGDIGSFAINIAQHRTRKVPKATWQWFELARFRRQNFDQVINIRGGLLQTDSITIDGGAKLRAGMSYAPGADGGLNPGYLSYAMLLRGTGATSGGGSMELGIELMYETGGATRLLTAQESMNVDNMSFVVPAGTGDAVLRYGCYLDRNGQMVLTILSRFDAFAARNNNVIRGSST
ncbi:DUF1983 domain-containing protein [Klebsiella pneumoniae]|nr:DUF1983 domain-containing protein [Klebsiella pneumoniae]